VSYPSDEDVTDEAVQAERERCAKLVEEFREWASCECSECKADARAHAVDEVESMKRLAAQIRNPE
jgi:hypothetical protein